MQSCYAVEDSRAAETVVKIDASRGGRRVRIRQIRERAFEKFLESPDGQALKGFWRAASELQRLDV